MTGVNFESLRQTTIVPRNNWSPIHFSAAAQIILKEIMKSLFMLLSESEKSLMVPETLSLDGASDSAITKFEFNRSCHSYVIDSFEFIALHDI